MAMTGHAGPSPCRSASSGFEATAPLLGLPHAENAGIAQRLAIAADHVLYGFVLDETRRAPQA